MRHILLATAATFAVAAPLHAKPVAPTVEALGAYPRIASPSLSPDGRYLAVLEGRGEERNILVYRTDALNAQPTRIGATAMKIQSVTFVKNGVLAVSLWQPYDLRTDVVTKTFVGKLFLTDIEGKNWREPIQPERARTTVDDTINALANPRVLSVLPNDPDHILVQTTVGNDVGDVYKVNVRTNRADKIQRSGENVAGYVVDLEGNLRGRIKADVDGGGAYVAAEFRGTSGGWQEHFRSYAKKRDQVDIVGFTEDPNIAIIRSNIGLDKSELYEYDIAARKRGETLFKHRFFEAAGVFYYPYKNQSVARFGEIMGVGYNGPRGDEIQYVSPAIVALDKSVTEAVGIKRAPTLFVDPATGASASTPYSAKSVDYVSYTPDFKTAVVAVDGPQNPPEFFLLRDGKLSSLGKAFPDIDPASLGTTQLTYYKARDGLTIPAFLTKPSAELCGAGPYRAVVHPHGGPWARDGMTFDYSGWVNLMSTRCIAVLRPQYRGSDGWSRKLWTAGDAEWGQKMQDDKDDGAKWLVDQKIAIPGRIAMFGFSYGGYASMAAAVRPNGHYKCAISGAGVSDIKRIWEKFYTNPFFRDAQAPTVKGSPAEQAANIKIPIMVYQGERDQIVPVEQANFFMANAKKSNQKVEYHLIKDYGHGPAWTAAIETNQLRLIDDYFAKGCGGGGL